MVAHSSSNVNETILYTKERIEVLCSEIAVVM